MAKLNINQKSELHKVTHIFSGKHHFFEVVSGESGKTYNTKLNVSCDCKFQSIQGTANSWVCSHILAILKEVLKKQKNDK